MAGQPHDDASREDRVDEVIASYLEAVERGETPDMRLYIAQHPDIALDLSQFFADRVDFQRVALGMGPGAPVGGSVAHGPPQAGSPNSGTATTSGAEPSQLTLITQPASPFSTLPVQFGRYQVRKWLGQGGMAQVFLAHDSKLDRLVALKIPLRHDAINPTFEERFLREARSAATINHPHVCPVFDVGRTDGQIYITMAYIEGTPLNKRVRDEGPLTASEATRIARDVAGALAEAHRRGIVHRDLKPSNIMLDELGRAIVMDFGLAQRSTATDDEPLTNSGQILGTPAYMSPEQAAGDVEATGPASDVYSLGAVLYEMLAGHPPFCERGLAKLLAQVERDPPPLMRPQRPDLDPALEQLCLKALEKKPNNRHPSMRIFAQLLDDCLRLAETPQLPIGIDLGTTYSVVACVDATGRPTTLLNSSGELLTPSAVAFEEGEVIVGREAVKGSIVSPDVYAECFKRDMGVLHYHRRVGGHDVPPEVLSAFLLERLKQDAERRLGQVRRVVITVPAFFDETRRKATQEAGRLAGLDVLDIINEPTAAALAYGYHRAALRAEPAAAEAGSERVLVFDLGGGTFDVTILEIEGRTFRTLATDGDVQLGGKDFDERLVKHVAEVFLAEHGSDPRSDARDAAQLWIDAQEAKHTLSQRRKTALVCAHAGNRMRLEITRAVFEELTRDLVVRTQTTATLVVKHAGLDWPRIDRVLLVGGSTRMPMVVDMLRGLCGREPDASQSADEVVAHGAALYAAMLATDNDRAPRFELINVNSHSLGVVGRDPETRQKINVVLVPRNTPLPCVRSKRFMTAKANQDSVKVAVVEGESKRPEYCIALGECVVRDLAPDLPAGTPVDVEYAYAANGTLSVRAHLPSTRQSAVVEIHRSGARDLGDLDTWRRQLGAAETEVEMNEEQG